MNFSYKSKGFTLIELLVVMSIVATLMSLVGPLAITALDKAEAKQEFLTVKHWLKNISFRAFSTGKTYKVIFSGKKAKLFINEQPNHALLVEKEFNSVFFKPQTLQYNNNGFVNSEKLVGVYRNHPFTINLNQWVNNQ